MSTFKRPGSKRYQYAFTVRGVRYRGSTNERTKTAADSFEAKLRTEILERGRSPLAPAKKLTLREFVPRFLQFTESCGLRPNTIRWYKNGLRLLDATELATMRLSDITTDDAAITQFPGGPYNANNALGTLGHMLQKAHEWHIIPTAPEIKMRKTQRREATINEEQEKALLNAIDCLIRKNANHRVRRTNYNDLRVIALLMLDAGLRPEEAFKLRWENVHWLENRIFIPDGKTPQARRMVPLSSRVAACLKFRTTERTGYVFPSGPDMAGHKKPSISGHREHISKSWNAAKKLAGFPKDVVLYSLRHTFASRVYAATGNLVAVMVVMGHSDLKSMQRYQHQDGATIAHQAVEKLLTGVVQ